jgi:hypothetical protein
LPVRDLEKGTNRDRNRESEKNQERLKEKKKKQDFLPYSRPSVNQSD